MRCDSTLALEHGLVPPGVIGTISKPRTDVSSVIAWRASVSSFSRAMVARFKSKDRYHLTYSNLVGRIYILAWNVKKFHKVR